MCDCFILLTKYYFTCSAISFVSKVGDFKFKTVISHKSQCYALSLPTEMFYDQQIIYKITEIDKDFSVVVFVTSASNG